MKLDRHRLILAISASALALTAGCGGDTPKAKVASVERGDQHEPSSGPTTTIDPQSSMLKFARCMRAHGVNLPDSTSNGSSAPAPIENSPTAEAAQKACQKFMPATSGSAATDISPDFNEKMLKLTKCLRGKGFKVPEPEEVPAGDSAPISVDAGAVSADDAKEKLGFDPSDPAFQKAQEDCSHKVGLDMPTSPNVVGK